MSVRQKALVAAAFFAAILIAGIIAYSKRTPRLSPELVNILRSSPSQDNLENQWADNDFMPLTDDDIRNFAAEVKIESKIPLSESETAELRATVEHFLKAYRVNASFQDLLAFRFPITNGTFVSNFLEYDKSFVRKHGQDLLKSKGLSNESLRTMAPLEVWELKRSLPIIQTASNCWTKVGKKGSVLVVGESERLPDMENLGSILTSYEVPSVKTWDISGWSPRFIFDPSPDEIIAKRGKVKHALLWLVVQSVRHPGNPAYCQVYYDDRAGTWLPCFLGQCRGDSFYLF